MHRFTTFTTVTGPDEHIAREGVRRYLETALSPLLSGVYTGRQVDAHREEAVDVALNAGVDLDTAKHVAATAVDAMLRTATGRFAYAGELEA